MPSAAPSSSASIDSVPSTLISQDVGDAPDIPLRPVSASPSRRSSFADNLDQLAFINLSAHKFPAASTSSSDAFGTSRRSSSSASTHRPTRSTPSSPRLAPLSTLSSDRRAISRPNSPSFARPSSSSSHERPTNSQISGDMASRRRRARSWVHVPGAAFTPAISTSAASSAAAGSSTGTSRIIPRRQVSSPGTTASSISANTGRPGRIRSTSASGTSSPPLQSERLRRPVALARHRQSSSARTSPVVSPLQPLTPAEQPPPHRTHSVPQMARISPLMYGLGYHYVSTEDLHPSQLGLPEGYFALPPAHSEPASASNFLEGDDVPPPYTASQLDLHAMSTVNGIETRPSRTNGEQDEEDEEGVLSFNTQSRQTAEHSREDTSATEGLRRRREAAEPVEATAESSVPVRQTTSYSRLRLFILRYLLHPLRLLAAMPGCLGTFWLLRNAAFLFWSQGGIRQHRDDDNNSPGAFEFVLASLWSMVTVFHATSFTTLLLRRWVHYYSILSSFIRLIALQAICWPLVRLTLYILGPKNPLASWFIISTTTAFSDTVARWVVSNITNDPSTVQERESHRSNTRKRRKKPSGATAFWRAVMGGPSDSHSDNNSEIRTAAASMSADDSTNRYLTESEADSDADIHRYRLNERQIQRSHFRGSESAVDSMDSQRVARIFHWDVAIRRNALPIAILSFISLLFMLLEQVQHRA